MKEGKFREPALSQQKEKQGQKCGGTRFSCNGSFILLRKASLPVPLQTGGYEYERSLLYGRPVGRPLLVE